MIKRIQLIILAVVSIVGAGWLLSQEVYAASIVTVTGYGDFSDLNPGDGDCDTLATPGNQCSLRAAIEELNAQGPDVVPHRINFGIATGSGPFTITVGSALPSITVPIVIDGETQPGASCPTASNPANLLIVLDGTNAGQFTSGLVFSTGSDGSVVRGLVIGEFQEGAIDFHSDENALRCSHIGVAPDGVTPFPNDSYAISINGDGNVIGGSLSHERRNVISGNEGGGMVIYGSGNNVRNNYIGTTADGSAALGNSVGVALAGSSTDNYIGGDTSMTRNIIADHWATGINIKGTNNFILGNYIGVGPDGTTPMPNTIGITMESDGNFVGGINPGEGNVIAYNLAYGIRVAAVGSAVENEIRGNSIYGSTPLVGTSGLGIDLDGNGVDTNDPGDTDTGPNEFQNYPSLHGISDSNILTGTLASKPNTTYFIDFYRNDSCDPSGYGEGEELVYWNSFETGLLGFANFTLDTTSWGISPGDYLTALATDPSGNTSEFSACLLVPSPPPTPTATPTNTPTATATPSPTSTASPTPTSTVSPTPTSTGSPPTATPTATVTIPANFPEKAYIPVVLK